LALFRYFASLTPPTKSFNMTYEQCSVEAAKYKTLIGTFCLNITTNQTSKIIRVDPINNPPNTDNWEIYCVISLDPNLAVTHPLRLSILLEGKLYKLL
jgi:hypothetical protein